MEKENNVKPNIIIEESKLKKTILCIIKGSALAIILSIILLTIYAILLTYTTLSETTIMPVVLIVTGISILIGSTIATRKIQKNGLFYGAAVGLIYIITLYLSSSISIAGFSLSANSFIMLAVGTITGMLGGIIGVNLSSRR